MKTRTKIFSTPEELAVNLADDLTSRFHVFSAKETVCNLAISGGETPKILFSVLVDNYKDKINWDYVHFYWVDERCVPVEDSESNFGTAKKLLFGKINISQNNIFRIKGEDEPLEESKRYSEIIMNNIRTVNNFPQFDLILLGLGEDGHTASLFPDRLDLLTSSNICDVAAHPVTFQNRITLTGNIINNAVSVLFLVTGGKKAAVVSDIIKNDESAVSYPASHIQPEEGELIWYLDKYAGELL